MSSSNFPIHIVRYEDIVNSPQQALKSLAQYILNIDDLSGTKIEHYIKIAVSEASP